MGEYLQDDLEDTEDTDYYLDDRDFYRLAYATQSVAVIEGKMALLAHDLQAAREREAMERDTVLALITEDGAYEIVGELVLAEDKRLVKRRLVE